MSSIQTSVAQKQSGVDDAEEGLFSGKGPLDSSEIEHAVHWIRQSAYIQSERLQAFVDGVVLAAEQVQNIRLDLLEKGPEVEAGLALIDVFVVFLLESSIPGILLTSLAKKIIRPILRTGSLWSKPYVREVKIWKQMMKEGAITPLQFKEAMRMEANDKTYSSYAWGIRALGRMSPEAQQDITALGKAGREAFHKDFSQPTPLESTDTPGVSVLDAALAFASMHRLAIFYHHSMLEAVVRVGISKETANSIMRVLSWETLEEDLKAIRDRFKLLYEAIIWALLCGFQKWKPIVGPTVRAPRLEGVDKRLVGYWLRRFGEQIAEWGKSIKTSEVNRVGVRRAVFQSETFEDLPPYLQLEYLRAYFMTIIKDLPTKLPIKVNNPIPLQFV